ncbi:MAG: bifunctional folylpolyglutamate synthase/dihydrofolate synthase [Syntrophothermus sp.]
MNYSQTIDYLFKKLPMFQRIGGAAYKADLTNTIRLCELLGNPQNSFRSIHVAGTNGKGSVSHMLASILQEAGLKTGLYTSPHLKDFRERIRINGKMIPKERVTSFVSRHKDDFEDIGLSFFEMTVGLAFDYFREEKVDIAVVEVGLGGRLDSTNVIRPMVSVITNISFDHMQFLGDTLEKIAKEKAGIIKPGVPVVIGETHPETEKVFILKSRKECADIYFADQHLKVLHSVLEFQDQQLIRHLDISLGENTRYKYLRLPLPGNYQEKNVLTVLATCQIIWKNIDLTEQVIRSGLSRVILNTGLMGRWQVLGTNPLIICDTGHNEAGISQVLEQIRQTPYRHLHFVFGVVNDKEIGKILKLLLQDATYYFCKADIPRGLDAKVLKEKANAEGLQGEAYDSVNEALNAAKTAADDDDLIFIGGSTFVVAEVVDS